MMKLGSLVLFSSLVIMVMSGCSSSPKESFYTLRAVAERDPTISTSASSWVNVGPVSVPELVDRPQVVLTNNDNQVEILEQTLWAATLQSIIGQVIAGNLTQLTGNPKIALYSKDTMADADYQVAIDVLRFDSVLGSAASLDAKWVIRTADGHVFKTGRSIISEPARGNDNVAALMAAHDKILAAVSRVIAQVLFKSPPSR